MPAVIGLCAFTHDSAAALIHEGELVGFAEEERLVGDKHTKVFPARAVDWLLREAGLTADQITAVGYNFDGRRYLSALWQLPAHLMNPVTLTRALPRAHSFARVHRRYRIRMGAIAQRFPRAVITPVLHHRTHGLYAFASSGYESAALLVADSLGEIQTTTIASASLNVAGGCDYQILEAIDDPASLGYAYGAVTEHLGWRRGDGEGTVMALAALGDPARFRNLLSEAIPLTATGFALNPALFSLRVLSSRYLRVGQAFVAATCPRRAPSDPVKNVHADLAAALQERTEQVMLHLADRAHRLTRSKFLCLAGGVAANCVAVGKIAEAGLFDEIHVPPAPGDSGTAVGAATSVYLDTVRHLPAGVSGHCYLGPQFDDLVIPPTPRRGLSAFRVSDPARRLARELVDGRIIGLFRGRLEAGPRALGNRSILASPLLPDVVTRLNATVKFREPFRPFAPVVLADKARDYFTLGQHSPFMSIASGVTELARKQIPAIVHVNGTARVQTVTAELNPFLSEVLTHVAEISGVPVLINTSLNIKGQPICGTPEMAIDCLASSGLDALLIEGWWVTK